LCAVADTIETVVVPFQIGVDVDARLVEGLYRVDQSGLRAVERGVAGRADIEAVVNVVSDGFVSGIGAARRRKPDAAIAGGENVGTAVGVVLPGRVEDFEDCGVRDVLRAGG